MISLIVARDRNGAIGRGGQMPWHLPEDLAFFRQETDGGALIMGSRTWASLPVRPLAGRLNCVVSRDPGLAEHVFPTVGTAVSFARGAGYDRIYGMGGHRIYAEMMALAHRLIITEVDTEADDPDTFFPDFDATLWTPAREVTLRDRPPACVMRELVRA